MYNKLKIFDSDAPALVKRKTRVAKRILTLRESLRQHFAESTSGEDRLESVRIATWNLREFGGGKCGGRDFEPLYFIAEVISHFDLVALQEIRGDLYEFNELMEILGPAWDYIATDVSDGDAGNGERMVYAWNSDRVRFRNIAGELTLAENEKIRAAFGERLKLENGAKLKLPAGTDLSGVYDAGLKKYSATHKKLRKDLEITLPDGSSLELPDGTQVVVTKGAKVVSPGRGEAEIDMPSPEVEGEQYRLRFPGGTFDDSMRQFARTPYLIAFQAGWLKLNLCTVHIYYGADDDPLKMEQRRAEIEALTEALADKADGEFKHDDKAFLGVLGDFNIVGRGHPTMQALENAGFIIPDELKQIPGSNVERDKAYDQIAFWKPKRRRGYARLEVLGANVFDFFEHVYTLDDEPLYEADNDTRFTYKNWRTYKMSDHLPMWIELKTDFGDEYLEEIG